MSDIDGRVIVNMEQRQVILPVSTNSYDPTQNRPSTNVARYTPCGEIPLFCSYSGGGGILPRQRILETLCSVPRTETCHFRDQNEPSATALVIESYSGATALAWRDISCLISLFWFVREPNRREPCAPTWILCRQGCVDSLGCATTVLFWIVRLSVGIQKTRGWVGNSAIEFEWRLTNGSRVCHVQCGGNVQCGASDPSCGSIPSSQ